MDREERYRGLNAQRGRNADGVFHPNSATPASPSTSTPTSVSSMKSYVSHIFQAILVPNNANPCPRLLSPQNASATRLLASRPT